MQRRQFLKATAAGAVLALGGPYFLGADDKSGAKNAVIGAGDHKYECIHGWGQLPASIEWQTTHGVAVDAAGLIYITHQGIGKVMDTVVVFDPQGKFVRSWGKEWHGGGHGIDIRKEGNEEFIYFTNTWKNPKVVKTNLKGEIVWTKNRPETKEYEDAKTPYNPTNVAFCPDGCFFVGDGYGAGYIQKFDKDGKLLLTFGGTGTEKGKFRTPHGNWVDTRNADKPVLVVCDRANARLQTFTLDGEYLAMTEKDTVLFPAHIDTFKDVMLVPDLHARVSLFDRNNKVIAHLGDDAEWRKKVLDGFKVRTKPEEWLPGKFVHPHDACFDKDGNIFVAEWVATGRITLLKKVSS
jgi:hypothetical protein